jgi:hypothetical protein
MRRHRRRVLAFGLVFVAACGSGEFGSVPPPDTIATSTTAESAIPATSTTDKPDPVETIPTTTTSGNVSDTTTSTPEPATSTTSEPSGIVQVPESLLAGVIEDAASKQNVGVVAVTVLSGQAVDWADGSLGCPEPGMSYVQVLTPGYLVLVDAGGVTLEYHLNQQGAFKQCTGGVYHPPSGY